MISDTCEFLTCSCSYKRQHDVSEKWISHSHKLLQMLTVVQSKVHVFPLIFTFFKTLQAFKLCFFTKRSKVSVSATMEEAKISNRSQNVRTETKSQSSIDASFLQTHIHTYLQAILYLLSQTVDTPTGTTGTIGAVQYAGRRDFLHRNTFDGQLSLPLAIGVVGSDTFSQT